MMSPNDGEPPPEKPQWMDAIEKGLGTIQHSQAPLDSLMKTMETAGGIIAWQVAVVSPGFLGLLWNAKTLSDHTHLSQPVFAVAFVIAEMAFLFGIVATVILHNQFTGIAMVISMLKLTLQTLQSMMERTKTLGYAQEGEGEIAKKLFEGCNTMNKMLVAHFNFPWYIRMSARVHGYLTILGYSAVALIVIAFKFN